MSQYPDPQSGWAYAGQQQGAYAAPPPTQNPHAGQGGSSYAAPSQYYAPPPPQGYPSPPPQGYAPPPPQGYAPPQGAPHNYGYAQGPPDGGSAYDQKNQGYAAAPYPPPGTYPPPGGQPYYDATGGSSPAPQEAKKGMSLATFFGPTGPPPMWQRPPAPQLPYNTFPRMTLVSKKDDLTAGFPEVAPPSQLNPHPFATHDVTEEDWKRFLFDVKKAGGLSPKEALTAGFLPMFAGFGLLGLFATKAMEKKGKYKHRSAGGDMVDHWNQNFFIARGMEVELHQGSERLSGRDSPDPEESPKPRHGFSIRDHLAERRQERAAEKAEKDWKARGDNKKPYTLVISALN